MHYELRLYPAAAVNRAYRRAASVGGELEAALESPAHVLTFDTMSSLAAAALADQDDLVGLAYAIDEDGTSRSVSIPELVGAVEAGR